MSTNKKWNRSSAFSPEVLAALNTATQNAVQNAVQAFEAALEGAHLTDDQRAAAYRLLADGVTESIAKFAESLKSK